MTDPTHEPGHPPVANTSPLIDRLLDEGAVGVCEVARLAGKFRRGRPTHATTVTRWITAGVTTPGGVVRLEAVRLNGRWVSSRAALVRFIAAQQLQHPAPAQQSSRTTGAASRATERAGARLESMGL